MKKLVALLVCAFPLSSIAAWKVKRLYNKKTNQSKIISVEKDFTRFKASKILLKSIPANLTETTKVNLDILYQEILFPTSKFASEQIDKINQKTLGGFISPMNSEVQTLIKQGPDQNRIVLTILGDGYTNSEKEKFFADAKRITDDLFAEKTFHSYLSLFNIYAVFVPSRESGITDRKRKDTAFGLYRTPKGSKRAIIPGNRSAIERALRMAPAPADYPIIIANDDFYGGLGGQYAITTRSHNSGSMVLRHELGHNFGNVGEEYDGGQVYSGANSSRTENVKWKHWIRSSRVTPYRAEFLGGDYIWQPLTNNPYRKTYRFPSGNYHLQMTASSVGWERDGDVVIKVNGQVVNAKGVFTPDRSFFEFEIKNYNHQTVEIEIYDPDSDGDDVLAFLNVYAFPDTYNYSEGLVQAFANYNHAGRFAGYRPTHKMCLMRDMRSMDFCPVDQENMWHEFLKRITLIDKIEVLANGKAKVHVPNLKGLEISWKNSAGSELPNLANKSEVQLPAKGSYQVEVKFKTPEVRKYNSRFKTVKNFTW